MLIVFSTLINSIDLLSYFFFYLWLARPWAEPCEAQGRAEETCYWFSGACDRGGACDDQGSLRPILYTRRIKPGTGVLRQTCRVAKYILDLLC